MKRTIIFVLSFISLLLCSCLSKDSSITDNSNLDINLYDSSYNNIEATSDNTITSDNNAGERNNTPVCLVPTATGEIVLSNSLASVDVSNANEGYIMAKYLGNNQKVKLQITGPDEITYTYNLVLSDYEAFPLSSGSGKYKISIFENITGSKYSAVLSGTVDIQITNIFGPNLYPNQYCNFNADSKVISKAYELCSECTSDLEVVTNIYEYVYSNISYDHEKAANVESGYTSNVDEILFSKTGICLDYAAVMTSMLRSQQIPTRLEVGYAGTAYHAWISTYIKEIGWVNGIIQFDGKSWSLMDPTFAANSSSEALKNFIGDGSNYKTKYVY